MSLLSSAPAEPQLLHRRAASSDAGGTCLDQHGRGSTGTSTAIGTGPCSLLQNLRAAMPPLSTRLKVPTIRNKMGPLRRQRPDQTLRLWAHARVSSCSGLPLSCWATSEDMRQEAHHRPWLVHPLVHDAQRGGLALLLPRLSWDLAQTVGPHSPSLP